MKVATALCLSLFIATASHADEASRKQKIQQIIEAQGLKQMFAAQLAQSQISATKYGENIYQKLTDGVSAPDPEKSAKFKAAFERFAASCSTLWSSEDLVGLWAEEYGKDLTEKDLDAILAYYRSPTGKKDVKASHAAAPAFTQKMRLEGMTRLELPIATLIADIKAAAEQPAQ